MSRRGHEREAGFTLIEIMAALAILGLALFMLLQAHYGAMQLFDAAREQVVLRELISKAVGIAEISVAAGKMSDSGEFGKRYPNLTYSFEAAPLSKDAPSLVEVRIRVEGPEEQQEFSFLMFLPEGA